MIFTYDIIKNKVKNNNVTDIIKTPKKSIIPRSEKQKDYENFS